MKVAIIEDEALAAAKLERYLVQYDPTIIVLQRLASVEYATQWLARHQQDVDLLFMDIQLTDGKSFAIFDQLKIHKPVIFTTAFDEYAIDAFRVNSIDYLLKPIRFAALEAALQKLEALKRQWSTTPDLSLIIQRLGQPQPVYKDRFLVKLGPRIHTIKTDDIALFFADGRTVYLLTQHQKKFILEYTLENLSQLLDPKHFFRVNRSFIVNINHLSDVVVYSNSRLKITVPVQLDKEIIVSREKVGDFKTWLAGGEG